MPWSGYLPKEQARLAMASKSTISADMYRTAKKEEPKTQSHQRRPALVAVHTYGANQAPLYNRGIPAKPDTPVDQDEKYQEAKATAIHMWNKELKSHPDEDPLPIAHRFQGAYERKTAKIGHGEGGKTDYMPWTYLLPVPSVEPQAERHASTSKPTSPHSPANDQPPREIAGTKPSPNGGEPFKMYEGESEYERERRYHTWRWGNRIQKVREGRDPIDWYEHARQFQKSFEKVTQDRRALNKPMPWSERLGKGKDDFGRGIEPRSEKLKENTRREERRGVR